MSRDLNSNDLLHIERLQALDESDTVDMFNELEEGLYMMYSNSKAESTYSWVQDNYPYYKSGDWRDVDT